jgi:hypothetical protein
MRLVPAGLALALLTSFSTPSRAQTADAEQQFQAIFTSCSKIWDQGPPMIRGSVCLRC